MGYSVGWVAGGNINGGRGRKDGWEERPRPPNPGWRLYGGSLSVRILIYAGTCRASQPLLHRAWNVLVAMQRLHSNICSRLQGFTAFIASCMECLVAMQLQNSNICEWLQGLHSPCSIMHGRIWIVAWAIWLQIT